MVILHNPTNGSSIEKVIFQGTMLDPHPKGELRQYTPVLANFLKETYPFLEEVDAVVAQKILNRPKMEFKCEFCDFATDTKVALAGHNRKHEAERAKASEPAIDPNLIPIVGGQKVVSNLELAEQERASIGPDIPGLNNNNYDRDGVEWTGEGLTEDIK